MMTQPRRVALPATRIMTLSEAKLHLKVDVDDDDDLISGLILAAEHHIDGYSGLAGRCMITQQWAQSFSNWPASRLWLTFPDVSAVVVSYRDSDNQQKTLGDDKYILQHGVRTSYLEWTDNFDAPSLYTRDDAVTVTMTCGYGDTPADVPQSLIHAAKLLVGAWYENRENTAIGVSVASIPDDIGFRALISGVRGYEI